MKRLLPAILAIMAMLILPAGCHPCHAAKPETKAPAPAPMVTTPCALPASSKAAGQYPGTGDVRLEKTTPEFVYLNTPFDYRIEATNIGSTTLTNVVITDTIAKNMKVNSTEPPITHSSDPTWNIGTLAPGEKKTIVVNATATGPATISGCAQVTYDRPVCAQIKVLEPAIALAVSAPKEVLICEDIPLSYTVTNSGSAELCGIELTPALPAGTRLSAAEEKTSYEMAKLTPAGTEKVDMKIHVDKPGTYTFGGNLTAQNDITAKASPVTVNVLQPVLKVESSAPEARYLGREAPFTVKVTNTGNGVSRDTTVVTTVRGGALSAPSTGGTVSGDTATWKIGALNPGETRDLAVTLNASSAGNLQADTAATGYCCQTGNSMATVQYKGVPAILLEMVDVSDPILVGANETYVITVTNQGSASDKNIKMTCKLDGNMEYVSSSGSTEGTFKDGVVEFAPVSVLDPKTKVTWKVIVKGAKEADARFYTEITSDMLTSPVTKTESTHFYK